MATQMNLGRPNALISVNATTYLSDANGQFTAADADVAQLKAMGCWVTPTLGANDIQVQPGQLVNIGGVPVVAGPDGVIRGLTPLQKVIASIASFFGGKAPLTQAGGAPSPTPPAQVTLQNLLLSTTAFTAGGSAGDLLATISGQTAGSQPVTLDPADTSGLFAVNAAGTQLLKGMNWPASAVTAFSSGLIETQAGAANSPKRTGFSGTIAAAGGAFTNAAARTSSNLATALASESIPAFQPSTGATGAKEILIDTSTTFKPWFGVGAAITDSSGWVLRNYLTASALSTLMAELYSPTSGLSINRYQMGDSDYTVRSPQATIGGDASGFKSYDDADPAGTSTSWSMALDDVNITPAVQAARAANPKLFDIACPWSPPAVYKATQQLAGPSGQSNYWQSTSANNSTYSDEFVLFAQGFKSRHGKWPDRFTIQNEAASTPASYPGCQWYGVNFTSFAAALVPKLNTAGITTKLLCGDDQWSGADFYQNEMSDANFVGAAFHSYAGNPQTAYTNMGAYANSKEVHLTESSELFRQSNAHSPGSGYNSTAARNAIQMQELMGLWYMPAVRYAHQSLLGWNLALDPNGQPGSTYANSTGNGAPPGIMPLVTISLAGAITRTPAYYSLMAFARFIRPGDVRCQSNTFDATGSTGDVQHESFLRTDGSVAGILFNNSSTTQTVTLKDQQGGGVFTTIALAAYDTYSYNFKNAAAVSAPDAPVVTANASAQAVTLTWPTASSNGAPQFFDVYMGTATGGEALLASNVTSGYAATGLTNGTKYFFYVVARNSAGSTRSNEASATPQGTLRATVVFSQNFTGTAGQNINQLTPTNSWVEMTGYTSTTGPKVDAAGTGLYADNTNDWFRNSTSPPSADYDVVGDFNFVSAISGGDGASICGRTSSTADTGYRIVLSGSGTMLLQKIIANTNTTLATWPVTDPIVGSTYRLRLSMTGTSISGYLNEALVGTQTDSSITAAGYGSIRMLTVQTSTTGRHIQDFSVLTT